MPNPELSRPQHPTIEKPYIKNPEAPAHRQYIQISKRRIGAQQLTSESPGLPHIIRVEADPITDVYDASGETVIGDGVFDPKNNTLDIDLPTRFNFDRKSGHDQTDVTELPPGVEAVLPTHINQADWVVDLLKLLMAS